MKSPTGTFKFKVGQTLHSNFMTKMLIKVLKTFFYLCYSVQNAKWTEAIFLMHGHIQTLR